MIDGMIVVGVGKTYPDLAVGLIVLGAIFFIISLWLAMLGIAEGAGGVGMGLAVWGIIASICIALYGVTTPPIKTIKVTVEPGTDVTEILRRYEVQTIDGQIWELVERDEALPDGDTE